MRELLLPVLKNDIALYESYRYHEDAPLSGQIDVFAGDADRATPLESTRFWSGQTANEMRHHELNGGHFFIENALEEIQRLVLSALNQRS